MLNETMPSIVNKTYTGEALKRIAASKENYSFCNKIAV